MPNFQRFTDILIDMEMKVLFSYHFYVKKVTYFQNMTKSINKWFLYVSFVLFFLQNNYISWTTV